MATPKASDKKPAEKRIPKAANNTDAVNQYMVELEHPLKAEMEEVRAIIMKASGKIAERIKWSAPSFYYVKDMAAFNPRSRNYVHLIFLFPDEMAIDDGIGILEGKHVGRREIKFHSMDDIKAKAPVFEKLVKDWVDHMDNLA